MYYSKNHLMPASPIEIKSWKFQQSWTQQTELYRQIQALEIDQPGASLPFSKRLERDHQWSLSYAQRVIEEYKNPIPGDRRRPSRHAFRCSRPSVAPTFNLHPFLLK